MKTEDLVLENQALINHIIKQMGLIDNRDDYFSVGQIGLINATKTFDESKGFKFSTYAGRCIEYEIIKEIYYRKRDKRKHNYNHISLDETIEGEKKDTPIYEVIDSGINVEEDYIKQEKIKLLYKIIAILEPRDRYMICHYFGLGCCEKLTLERIDERLGLKKRSTEYRVKKILKIMRKIMIDKLGDE